MTPEFVVNIGRQALETVFMLAGPMLLAGMITGLSVSLFQATTQINEQTLSFIPKIVAVLTTLLIFAPWMIKIMLAFTRSIYANIANIGP